MIEKQESLEKLSRLLKLISNKNRLSILFILYEQPMTVGFLNKHIQIGQSALSQHLGTLKAANFIDSKKTGSSVQYSLVSEELKDILSSLKFVLYKKNSQYITIEEKKLTLNEKPT